MDAQTPSQARRQGPACPRCASRHAESVSAFGSHLMTAQFRCRDCRQLFQGLRVVPTVDPR